MVEQDPKTSKIDKDFRAPQNTEAKVFLQPENAGYFSRVSNFFNEQKGLVAGEIVKDGEIDYENYYVQQQRSMEKLATPALAKKMKPEEVSIALAEISSHMSVNNPYIEANTTGDKSLDNENVKRYEGAKAIFLESCSKIYPETKVLTKATTVKNTVEVLRANGLYLSVVEDVVAQESDPKKLAAYIDSVLYLAGNILQQRALENYQEQDFTKQDAANQKLAQMVKGIYELQLMRDELQQRLYGSKDKSAVDAKQIDQIREQLKPNQEQLSAKELQLIDTVNFAIKGELQADKLAEENGGAYLRQITPIVNAFRALYKDNPSLAIRLNELVESVQKMTKQKLASKADTDPKLAQLHATTELYGSLTSAEKQVLATAIDRESQRIADVSRRQGGLVAKVKNTPESYLVRLMGLITK
jgi:hypothetical protein